VADGPLDIVHVAAPAPVGGLERVVQALAIGHHQDGHRVRVVAVVDPAPGTHPFVARLEESGVPVEVLRLPARAYLRERRMVRACLQRERPDVVHTHGYRPDLLDAGVARSLGIPIVSTVHGSSRLGGKTHLYEWIQLHAWRRFDAVIAVSRPLEGFLRTAGVAGPRVHVVPNAWPGAVSTVSREEARRRLGLGETAFAVGFVGRLIRAKGPDVLVRALPLLGDVPWRAVIIGEGGERPAVERLVRELGLAGRVTLTGHLDDATDRYRAFDAFVLSSRTEGTPITLFEAMAADVPIVACAVGGVPDVVSAQEAILVPADDPGALAAALRAIAESPGAARGRSTAAAARVRRDFGREAWLARHAAIYRQVAGRAA
jgi:glycosyltransferase involved in cell wall biosynthesis